MSTLTATKDFLVLCTLCLVTYGVLHWVALLVLNCNHDLVT
jgi:hypothetical protein